MINSKCKEYSWGCKFFPLTLLHSEWPKLYGVLAILRAIGLSVDSIFVCIHCPRACSNRKSKKLFSFMKMVENDGDVPILKRTELHHITELQIKGGTENNSKIFFLIYQQKHVVTLIRIVLVSRF